MKDWPNCWMGYSDDKKKDGQDFVIGPSPFVGQTWVAWQSYPHGDHELYTEFEITTDPAEAPADCRDMEFVDGTTITLHYVGDCGPLKGGLWPFIQGHGIRIEWGDDLYAKTTCPKCNGSGRVHGMIFADAWTCDACDGKGVV